MLQTERLSLRALRQTDVDTLFDYRNDARCARWQRYWATDRASLRSFVQTYANSSFPFQETEQHYAIVRREDLRMIGDLSIFFTEADNCFTLGITVAPPFQGQGYAYELLDAVTARLRERYSTVDLVALIERENTRSIALFRRLGFTEECYAERLRSLVFVRYGVQE